MLNPIPPPLTLTLFLLPPSTHVPPSLKWSPPPHSTQHHPHHPPHHHRHHHLLSTHQHIIHPQKKPSPALELTNYLTLSYP